MFDGFWQVTLAVVEQLTHYPKSKVSRLAEIAHWKANQLIILDSWILGQQWQHICLIIQSITVLSHWQQLGGRTIHSLSQAEGLYSSISSTVVEQLTHYPKSKGFRLAEIAHLKANQLIILNSRILSHQWQHICLIIQCLRALSHWQQLSGRTID